MVLPLLFSWLAPQLLGLSGTGAMAASAVGGGLGSALQGDNFLEGMAMGALGPMLGGAGGGGEGIKSLFGGTSPAALQTGQVATGSGNAAATALAPGNAGIAGQGIEALMPPAAAESPGFMSGLMNDPAKLGILAGGAAALSSLMGGADDGTQKYKSDRDPKQEARPIPRTPMMPTMNDPGAGTREFDYNISTPQTATMINDYTKNQPRYLADGGMLSRLANPNMPGLGPMRLARGGIVALAEGGNVGAPEAMQPPVGQPNEREIVSGAVAAIKGESPDPQVALGAFLTTFGEAALRDLVDKVQLGDVDDTAQRFRDGENGQVSGPGDGSGTDDKVPAQMEDGSGDVMLSDGEFVMRKDATDALEKTFGEGFLDKVNDAGPRAGEAARKQMASA
jgi:hypothetical protein